MRVCKLSEFESERDPNLTIEPPESSTRKKDSGDIKTEIPQNTI
jgi:hypothetical protein